MSLSWLKRNLFWLNDQLHGSKIGQFYDELCLVNSNFEKGYTIQQEHLQTLLKYAAENSPFYKEMLNWGGLLRDNYLIFP